MQFRLLLKPVLYNLDQRFLFCRAQAVDDEGSNDGNSVFFLLERTQVRGSLRAGDIICGSELRQRPELNALVLEPQGECFIPKGPAPGSVTEVQPPVPTDPGLPPENGWGDSDDVIDVSYSKPAEPAPRHQPQRTVNTPTASTRSTPAPQPSIGATVNNRRRAVLEAGDKIPLDLLRSLRITAHSYNLVSQLVGAVGKPGPQDVRAMVITNIINWSKNESPAASDASPQDLVAEAEAQLERVLKEYA